MSDTPDTIDYSRTLNLPQTEFPMRAGLPEKEPQIVARWQEMDLYRLLREDAAGRPRFVLHDGPPYANGNIHIGHALNKVLKDIITRSFQMRGYDSNYVPGWDCHGLPIEWKIEEQYRAKGKDKPDFSDGAAINAFRKECREFASHWIGVQAQEFQRLGVVGDFANPYTTMAFHAESRIAGELMKFAMSDQLYRGSKPVMWSVVERTALAEAEVEYQDYESDTVWVKFPVRFASASSNEPPSDAVSNRLQERLACLRSASVVIWTTTPWTIPGNRAISYSPRISYGLYEVTAAENDFGPRPGEKLIFADALAEDSFAKAKLGFRRLMDITEEELQSLICDHPLKGLCGGYEFPVPLIEGEHVTDDAGTGFVHTAPGHGREDFDVWMEYAKRETELRRVARDYEISRDPTSADATNREFGAFLQSLTIPFTVDDAGFFTRDAPGFGPDRPGGAARVIDDNGKKGDANKAVIDALIAANMLFARGRLKHQYPHSWRSKKPVIFRNTPQWFVHMDKELGGYGRTSISPLVGEMSPKATEGGEDSAPLSAGAPPSALPGISPSRGEISQSHTPDTLRTRALAAIDATRFVPAAGQNRLRAMIEERPDWVLSRQRAWGVPIAVFVNEDGEVLKDPVVNARILQAFKQEGADAWFAEGARERFLGARANEPWKQVKDILDVWFDSGSTHTFTLEDRPDMKWPADVYLEGSDQHRGWFHSSLLESCGTRGRAPYDTVITHGFTMDEDGRKMSKSLGNTVVPQDVMKQSGADILRLWVATTDYGEDQRLGKHVLQTNIDAYRKLRNTIRWMLGTLAHDQGETVAYGEMPELERLMLHRLVELDQLVRKGYDDFDFKRISRALLDYMVLDLSAFYFDIRKDALYCDAPSSLRRKAALQVVRTQFHCLVTWLAPLLPFTMEEAWLDRYPDKRSVHLEQFPALPPEWRDEALAEKWRKVRQVRRVVTGALEIERKEKKIGSSLEAAPLVFVGREFAHAFDGLDADEIFITSGAEVLAAQTELAIEHPDIAEIGPSSYFIEEPIGERVAVKFRLAVEEGLGKCARSWRYTSDIGSDPDFPEVSARDAAALRELRELGRL